MIRLWGVLGLIAACLLGLAPNHATAEVFWSTVASACMPSDQAVQANSYISQGNVTVTPGSGLTGGLVLICPIPASLKAGQPDSLGLTYRDSTGKASGAFVKAELLRVNRATGQPKIVSSVSSDSAAATGTAFRSSPSFSHSFDFALNYYVVRIEISRALATQDVRGIGVLLESTCGNGAVKSPEQCDDGNINNGDGCGASCTVEAGFNCSGSPSTCTAIAGFCTLPSQCPAGSNECQSATCTTNTCGILNADPGQVTAVQTAGDCKLDICDGAGGIASSIDDGDVPDDANQCTVESCTAGQAQSNPSLIGTACSSNGGTMCDGAGSCVPAACGDGVTSAPEQCDDSNTVSGDGCSASCTIEDGYDCTGSPSICTAVCGNSSIEPGENCDGVNLGNTSCLDLGFGSGSLACNNACQFDTTQCIP